MNEVRRASAILSPPPPNVRGTSWADGGWLHVVVQDTVVRASSSKMKDAPHHSDSSTELDRKMRLVSEQRCLEINAPLETGYDATRR